jgi:anti-sigma factor RsiW
MIGWRRTTACERASQWISLDLDGELSDLEHAGLARHLERCEGCRRLSAELVGLTTLLRTDPPAEPSREITLPAPRRQRARVANRIALGGTFAACAAAVAVLLTTSSPTGLLGPASAAIAFSDRHEQIAFVHNKYLQMEPLRAAALTQLLAESVPAFSRRALR